MSSEFSRITIMFCLPRSRSQWFAWFMGQATNVDSLHDPLKEASHPDHLVRYVKEWAAQPSNANRRLFLADTAASMFHRRLTASLPGVQQFFVLRQPAEVVESLRRQIGFNMHDLIFEQAEHLELVLERVDRRMIFDYNDLGHGKLFKLWDYVTDKQALMLPDLRERAAKVIDKPVLEQRANPDYVRSLLAYREWV